MEVLAGAGGGRGVWEDPVFGPLDTRNSRNPKVPRFSRGSFSKPGRFLHFWGPFSGFRGVQKWSKSGRFLHFRVTFWKRPTRKPRYFGVSGVSSEFSTGFRVFGPPEVPKSQSTEVFSWVLSKSGSVFKEIGSSRTWNCDFLTRNFKFLKFTQNFIDFTRKPRYFRVQKLVKFLGYYYIF